jgi:outer membrane biosynthesis protein TonB
VSPLSKFVVLDPANQCNYRLPTAKPIPKPKPKPKPQAKPKLKPTSVSSNKPSAGKPTPIGTLQSKKRPPPSGSSGLGKKPKAKPEIIDLDVFSAGESPSSVLAGPPLP